MCSFDEYDYTFHNADHLTTIRAQISFFLQTFPSEPYRSLCSPESAKRPGRGLLTALHPWDVLVERRLASIPSLDELWRSQLPEAVEDLVDLPSAGLGGRDIDWAQSVIDSSDWPLLPNLVPLMPVDERSIACVVLSDVDGPPLPGEGAVVRWHLDVKDVRYQAALLDTDCLSYIQSVTAELAARDAGLRRVLDKIGPAYEHSHLEKEKRPRDYVVRPVRIACQNVIVGLAAFAQDSSFDGLAVPAWQTCEVPHVATHEGNRALAALTLCDAFQNGGTMEIRFDREAHLMLDGKYVRLLGHPERAVPASLRRFGRTVGVQLGVEDPKAITPAEARELFLAITPMPGGLRARVETAVRRRGITPERICFLLLSQVWREIEMDFILSGTSRARSILDGGSPWTDRASRQAESEVCRAAAAVGMLFRRLNSTDAAADTADVRVVEDRTKGIGWMIDDSEAAVTFAGLDPGEPVPWTRGVGGVGELTVYPRTAASDSSLDAVHRSGLPGHKALLVPADVPVPAESGVTVLRCPERLADLDRSIEDRLLKSRISRG